MEGDTQVLYGIWVVSEWLTNNKRTTLLFETKAKAEIVRQKLDADPEQPMEVRECEEDGEIYQGKLLDVT